MGICKDNGNYKKKRELVSFEAKKLGLADGNCL